MEAAVYMIPVPLDEVGVAPVDRVLPPYNHDIVMGIRHFIVENVRTARRFLKSVDKAVDIDALTFRELNGHTPPQDVAACLSPLAQEGLPVGVLSEAGCPGVADPGAAVVAQAQRLGLKVVPLVGPSSIIMAVMASGCSGQSFAFNGYLPVKAAERDGSIRRLESRAWREGQTQLFIEAPYRNLALLRSLLAVCRGDTLLCIAAGLTCPHEFVRTRTVGEWRGLPPPDINRVPAIFVLGKGGAPCRR